MLGYNPSKSAVTSIKLSGRHPKVFIFSKKCPECKTYHFASLAYIYVNELYDESSDESSKENVTFVDLIVKLSKGRLTTDLHILISKIQIDTSILTLIPLILIIPKD